MEGEEGKEGEEEGGDIKERGPGDDRAIGREGGMGIEEEGFGSGTGRGMEA